MLIEKIPGTAPENCHNIPRILIAGTHSGCGKTTVARGIMQVLVRRGLVVQPFKVGPDFIDPTHHTRICGRASRNLDPFLMGEQGVIDAFVSSSAGADIAVIEGVMGCYDGLDGTGFSSTAHVASILGAPTLLVIDVKGMARSSHAVIEGFCRYDPDVPFTGVIFNRVGSERHKALIEKSLGTRVYGWVMRREEFAVGSRHLGLHMAFESDPLPDLAGLMDEFCDIDAIISTAGSALPVICPYKETEETHTKGPRMGVALDEAFCFYYQDNLERFKKLGAQLIFFSPMTDPLPDVDGLYLGGGYPELHAPALSRGKTLQQIKRFADSGRPVLAECGGLLYLTKEIMIRGGETFPMAGVLPGRTVMKGSVQALGYSEGVFTTDAPAFAGCIHRGHEFHYSIVEPERDARFGLHLCRGKGITGSWDGMFEHRSVGTYTHAYFSHDFVFRMITEMTKF